MVDICLSRLKKEYKDIMKNPVPNIRAAPLESNLLEWHYVVEGPKATPYENGWYHGKLVFTRDYPFKPPAVYMITPNGRFKEMTKLCLSMSDFHPELWNTQWSVSSIIMGLLSFMVETTPTAGSIQTSTGEKKMLARKSLEYNCRDKIFCELFPELVELYNKSQEMKAGSDTSTLGTKECQEEEVEHTHYPTWLLLISILGVLCATTWGLSNIL